MASCNCHDNVMRDVNCYICDNKCGTEKVPCPVHRYRTIDGSGANNCNDCLNRGLEFKRDGGPAYIYHKGLNKKFYYSDLHKRPLIKNFDNM